MTARRPAVAEGAAHGIDVADVAFDQRRAQRRLAVAGRQVVVDDDAVAGLAERLGGVAADVAGATRDQDDAAIRRGQWSNR